jgi:hypothetical protein
VFPKNVLGTLLILAMRKPKMYEVARLDSVAEFPRTQPQTATSPTEAGHRAMARRIGLKEVMS